MRRLLCLTIALNPAWAQLRDNQDHSMVCDDRRGDRRLESFCEIRGGMRIDFPVTLQGSITKRLSVQLGSGGPTVRAVTTNGGVTVKTNEPRA